MLLPCYCWGCHRRHAGDAVVAGIAATGSPPLVSLVPRLLMPPPRAAAVPGVAGPGAGVATAMLLLLVSPSPVLPVLVPPRWCRHRRAVVAGVAGAGARVEHDDAGHGLGGHLTRAGGTPTKLGSARWVTCGWCRSCQLDGLSTIKTDRKEKENIPATPPELVIARRRCVVVVVCPLMSGPHQCQPLGC